MSNQNEFQYLEAKEFLHLPVIEISDVKSFTRFANANDLQYIFKIIRGGNIEFFFPLNSIIYKLNGADFQTLADMLQAANGKYPNAKEYYESKNAGYSNYDEYRDVGQTGNYSKEDYEAAKNAGFVKSFDKFKSKYTEYKKNPLTSIIPADIDNAVMLHQYALQKEIKTYDEFEKIYTAGFPDNVTYNDAIAKGFSDGKNYDGAVKRGFNDSKEYKEAVKLNIETKKDYDEYRFLKDLNEKYEYTFDKLQLLIALSNCENGTTISLAEARTLLQKAQEKLKKPAGNDGHRILPLWYTRSIDKEDKLLEFIKTNQELKKFGFFNTAKNSFEIFKVSAVRIIVDGSNVAHNGKPTPDLNNIRAMVKELAFCKFKNIVILVDASLRHKLKFPLQLEELKKELMKQYELHETPSKTSADQFLIATAKKEKCRIVSNDEFKDWKKTDPWVKDKIDSIRIPFRILKGQKVLLDGIEDLREKPVEA